MYSQWGKEWSKKISRTYRSDVLHQPLSSRPGTQQESAQEAEQKDKLLELLNLQLFAAGRRILGDRQVPEQTHFLQPFSRSGSTENQSRIGSGSLSVDEHPCSSVATTASRGSAGPFARCCWRSSCWYVTARGHYVKIHWRKPQPLTLKKVFLENMTILVY